MPAPTSSAGLASASWGRRILALVIDWLASSLVSFLVLGAHRYGEGGSGWVTLLIYLAESAVGTALAGASFGQLLTRIRVLRTNGRPVSLLLAFARSALICLVVPPLIFKPDGRGLHDLWTDTGAYLLPASRG